MRNRSSLLALLAAASLSGVVLLNVAPAFAQVTGAQNNIAALDYNQTDAREALRNLFKLTGVSYTLSPDIQGTVTLSLRNVSFDTALQNLTRQVDATYRIEGGVYHVVPRETAPQPVPGAMNLRPFQTKPSNEPYMLVDGNFLFAMHDGVVDKVDKRTMKVVGTAMLSKGK